MTNFVAPPATDDETYIRRCMELAEPFRGRTSPNPLVGCVILDAKGHVIAEGAHHGPGTDHAEIDALKKLKPGKAKGGTLYCNLEPCNHHGRTPPCAPVVRDSGVARVVIGTDDPVPGHGGGIELLEAAKIAVTNGVLYDECAQFNRPFFTHSTYGRPTFTLKAAITLDGKIATVAGQSKWITNEHSRADVMRLRNTHDAVLVGISTVLADDPWLTNRLLGDDQRDPIRIVIDSKLRTPPDAHVLAKASLKKARTIIACGPDAPKSREDALAKAGAQVWRIRQHRNGRLELSDLAHKLGKQNITSVLVEGGGEIHAYMLEKHLADELYIYVAPKVVGGPAKSWVGGKGLASLQSSHKFKFDDEVDMLSGDVRLHAVVLQPVVTPFVDD